MLKNKKIWQLFPIGILLFVSVISHIAWLNSFTVLTNGDIWFLYTEAMKTANWGTWVSTLSLGDVNVSYNLFLLTSLWQVFGNNNLNYQIANQVVYFFPIIFVTPIGTFYSLRRFTHSNVGSFVGTLVYLYTTIFLMMQNGGLLIAMAYTLLPILFFFLDRYLSEEKITDGLWLVLFLSVALFYELRITYITIFVFAIYILGFFIFRYREKAIRHFFIFVKKSFFLGFLLLIINSYIYLPLFFSVIKESAGSVLTRGLFGANFFTIQDPFTLMHPFWTGKVPAEFIPQPIPLYFWIFPLYAFFSLVFAKKSKKILFFAFVALVMVFLGKSASDPFGWIYSWLYFNFPGFGFFREPSKFWIMLSFSYSVLIAYTIVYGVENIKKVRRSKLRLSLQTLFLLPIIIVALHTGKPAFTEELGPLFKELIVPQDHYYTKNFISQQKEFFRTYYVPGRYRMAYWSEIHPMLGLNEVPEYFQTLNPQILSLLSVKYVIIPPDITNDVYRIWGSKPLYLQSVQSEKGLKRLDNKEFGSFSVFENTEGYKPHIYTTDSIVQVNGKDSQFLSLLPLTSNQGATVSFSEKKQDIPLQNSFFITAECVRCGNLDYRTGLVYPFARFFPGSAFYNFVIAKENKTLQNLVGQHLARLQQANFYAAKRIIEVQQMTDYNTFQQFITTSLREQKRLLNQMKTDFYALDIRTPGQDELMGLFDYLDIQIEIANYTLTNKQLNASNQDLIKENTAVLSQLRQDVLHYLWMSDGNTDRYLLSIPKTGQYTLYAQQDLSAVTAFSVDGVTLQTSSSDAHAWIKSTSYLLEKGVHKVAVQRDIGDTLKPFSVTVPKEEGEYTIKIPFPQTENNVNYNVSFVSKVTQGAVVRYYIDRDSDFEQEGIVKKAADQFLRNDGKWHEVDNNFTARFGERSVFFVFTIKKSKGHETSLSIEHIKIQKRKVTTIAAELEKQQPIKKQNPGSPSITFQWINPTKYIVHVKNAKNPYYLILNENFHPGWGAYFLSKDKKDGGKVVATYSQSHIKELEAKNDDDFFSFLAMFDKSLKNIPEHISVNGYANAWYVDKPGDYTIQIEFIPQRIFMVCIVFSALALGITMLLLVFFYVRNEKK